MATMRPRTRKALPKSKPKKKVKGTPVSPLSFRMPRPLRARLRRFAEERNLAEAEALRLALSSYLDDMESQRELLAAERWQFQQAYATWQKDMRGELRTVPYEEIEQIFKDALSRRKPAARSK